MRLGLGNCNQVICVEIQRIIYCRSETIDMLKSKLAVPVRLGEMVLGRKSFTSTCILHNKDWLTTQKTAARQESERRHQLMVAAQAKSKAAEEADLAREEAARAELLARQSEMPPDQLGEDYFKDKKRFNIAEDQRDPVYRGSKSRADEPIEWRSFVKDGVQKGKETLKEIRESTPFEAYQMEVREGEIGYAVIRFAKRTVILLVSLFLFFGFLEVKWHFDNDIDAYSLQKEAYDRHHTDKFEYKK